MLDYRNALKKVNTNCLLIHSVYEKLVVDNQKLPIQFYYSNFSLYKRVLFYFRSHSYLGGGYEYEGFLVFFSNLTASLLEIFYFFLSLIIRVLFK